VNLKFAAAMSSYVGLAVLAGFTLTGDWRIAVWIFLGGIAIKTWLVVLKDQRDK
jgi:hypothetical protein